MQKWKFIRTFLFHKKILLREEDSESGEVQISSLVSGTESWFFPRAKCYPLYSLMLAVNRTEIDVLSLGCQSQELEVRWKTYPKSRTVDYIMKLTE